jgi:hypothetical protein
MQSKKQSQTTRNSAKTTGHTAVYTGYITPVQWDSNNKIKGISLLTADQEEIRIVNDAKAQRLLSLIWEKVELEGLVQIDKQGVKKIKVQHYTPADYDSIAGDMDISEENLGASEELKEVLSNNSWFSGFDETEITRNF